MRGVIRGGLQEAELRIMLPLRCTRITLPLLAIACAMMTAGCAASTQPMETRPFFQHQYDIQSHGRKTWFDRMVELDPGNFKVEVAKNYLQAPPQRIAVLPFTDYGSANFVLDGVPVTWRNSEQRANWSWTDSQRIRQSLDGYLAEREFTTNNLIAVDAVLRAHGITDAKKLQAAPPEELGRWLGVDAVVYGNVRHYEGYYFFLVAAWRVGVDVKMVSTHNDEILVDSQGSRYDMSVSPAFDPIDIVLNSAGNVLHLRDINLARSEEETCREIAKRIPISYKLRAHIAEEALSSESEQSRAAAPDADLADRPAAQKNSQVFANSTRVGG
ncbi:MAG: GNA1162 family protein [Candidatus Binataceae bacterium]